MRPLIAALAPFLLLGAACTGPLSKADAPDPRLEWWQDARFGLFLHWGLYSIPAGVWKDRTDHAEWIMNSAHIPVPEYEKFLGRFNPAAFDADAWARMAREAGMGYVVITTKHHDGFALFDSAVSDYDVMATPFKRDIMKELSEACAREGLRMGWYYSIMDWHHPDYLPRRSWEQRSAEGADFARYVRYLRAQVTELLTHYGPIGVMWFDGEWEGNWDHARGQALYDLCRRLQPEVLVNNRVDKGRGGMAGMQTGPGFAGDFGTPEQEIPSTGLPGVAWETCMTMNRNWGYNSHDHDFKSARELVLKLVDVASKGGNFLLNVGPTSEGRFPPESISRLKEIGAWMRVHGEAIHGTQAGPLPALPWGRCTQRRIGRRTILYLHVFDWPEDGVLVVPGIGNRARRAALMGREEDSLAVLRRGPDLLVNLPRTAPVSLCPVVALEIEGPPVIFRPPVVSAVADIFVNQIQVRLESSSRDLEVRYTVDDGEPDFRSPRYRLPLHFTHTTTLKARSFFRGRPVGPLVVRTFTRVRPRPASAPLRGAEGFTCRVFAGEWDRLPDFDSMQPSAVEEWGRVRLPPGPPIEFAGRRFSGILEIPGNGLYLFALNADDGARLWIDGELVVDNDGLHGPRRVQGRIALARGGHEIRVDYFNKTGGAALRLEMAPAGGAWKEVEALAAGRM